MTSHPGNSIRYVIPVASGKGGVGKSTVTANLALALARGGARVGVMDADVYGPSIPTILGVKSLPEMDEDDKIRPVEQDGLKIISMGFFMAPEQAVVWRGPMLHKTMQQFLNGVIWGELDYLLVDLPPGTGDIQLSLCQSIPIAGAVIVSTPQDVALNVAQKAIAMFRQPERAGSRRHREHERLRVSALRRARRHLRRRRRRNHGRAARRGVPRGDPAHHGHPPCERRRPARGRLCAGFRASARLFRPWPNGSRRL